MRMEKKDRDAGSGRYLEKRMFQEKTYDHKKYKGRKDENDCGYVMTLEK